MQDIEKAEVRLEQAKMKDKVLFHCSTRRYLKALKKEWEKAEKAKTDAKKAAGKSKKKAGKQTSVALPASHSYCRASSGMFLADKN